MTEHLSLTLTMSSPAAVAHANEQSSTVHITLTASSLSDPQPAARGVELAGLLGNATTRFADSFRYGFDAKAGINIRRVHAWGAVGLEGVVIYRYVLKIHDEGHVVGEFGREPGRKQLTHHSIEAKELPFSSLFKGGQLHHATRIEEYNVRIYQRVVGVYKAKVTRLNTSEVITMIMVQGSPPNEPFCPAKSAHPRPPLCVSQRPH